MAKKLTKAVCAQIAHLVSYGYTQRTIAQMVGVSEDTLSMAKKTNPDLKRAFTIGKSITTKDIKANIHKLAMTAKSDGVKLAASAKILELIQDDTGPADTLPTDAEILAEIRKTLQG